MANEQNLIPLNKRTQRERKEIAQKGAEASNKKQKEKKELKQELELLLQSMDGDKTKQERMCISLLQEAISGNVKAFETIRDTIGQKPKEQIEITKPVDETIKEVDEYVKQRS